MAPRSVIAWVDGLVREILCSSEEALSVIGLAGCRTKYSSTLRTSYNAVHLPQRVPHRVMTMEDQVKVGDISESRLACTAAEKAKAKGAHYVRTTT